MQDLQRAAGLPQDDDPAERERLVAYIHLKLAALGYRMEAVDAGSEAASGGGRPPPLLEVAHDLLANYREQQRLLVDYLPPVDYRIQAFLDRSLADVEAPGPLRLPGSTLVLDRYGLARELSLPAGRDEFRSRIVESYRCGNGVLHNPLHDRRTTAGVFHVVDYDLPVPSDKVAISRSCFAHQLWYALRPPLELRQLPFTAEEEHPLPILCSLLLRPLMRPGVTGWCHEQRLETRFFAPGALVANLDFVESIFGNAGDPYLPHNDAGLEAERWSGHSGCVILAPHLAGMPKKAFGLPHVSEASDAERASGMCYERDDEPYNEGRPFKACLRSRDGVMVTLIGDNYFGYCKKEVKTQISFAANLGGLAEEEHAGGALAFPSFQLGEEFALDRHVLAEGHRFRDLPKLLGGRINMKPEGYGVDVRHSDIVYVPEDVHISMVTQKVTWTHEGLERSLPLRPDRVYVLPVGFKIRLEKHPGAPTWRLVGTRAEGTFCHKPCTVSGGGKSEISKPLTDAVIYGSLYVADVDRDLELIDQILKRDYGDRFLEPTDPDRAARPILSSSRSLGSVIKLLTPSPDFTPAYNDWLESIPPYVRALVFIIKRFYRDEWGEDWRAHFGVDIVNGGYGHEFKYHGRKLVGSYLRVGITDDGAWRTYKLRQDFIPADKVQMEDDISASVTVPPDRIAHLQPQYAGRSVKLLQNCEYRLFQRPDDAIHRGFDRQTERDLARPGNFISNFAPLDKAQLHELLEDVIGFDQYTQPMQDMLRASAERRRPGYVVSSAHPRIVDGKPTKNPRYLQVRPDLERPRDRYLAELGVRLYRRIPSAEPVHLTVDAVLAGRRNNPADPQLGVPPLAVYNPIHYQELPELFMDFICSVTGRSPSTTGFGSEGALTKGPFNALPATADLNAALLSWILCGHDGFSTAAGHVGPKVRVDHDISLLIPEIWSRLGHEERDARFLIEHGYLEKLEDFEHEGRTVLASRLGYRITTRFVHGFLGRIFDDPVAVFSEDMLAPEQQDREAFVEGIDKIVLSQREVARAYIESGTVRGAVPPLQALLHVMADGSWNGKGIEDPELRALFDKEHVLASDWYQQRLHCQQERDIVRWERRVSYLRVFLERSSHESEARELGVEGRLARAEAELERVRRPGYLDELVGSIGADPFAFDAEAAESAPSVSAGTE